MVAGGFEKEIAPALVHVGRLDAMALQVLQKNSVLTC